jgi:hypothetical protein
MEETGRNGRGRRGTMAGQGREKGAESSRGPGRVVTNFVCFWFFSLCLRAWEGSGTTAVSQEALIRT